MKQQRYGRNNTTAFTVLACCLLTALVPCSCENDIQKIRSLTSAEVLPEATGENFEMIYSDSALVKVRVEAEEVKQFKNRKRPYIEFPRGMTATFFDDSLKVESIIRANYVIYYNEENLWEAKNDVEARNLKTGEQLNTEHLFWDENKKLIYSNTYSRIVNEDGTFYSQDGFEASQDFSWWQLKGAKGTVNIRDE